ncbi:hypothetical protein TNCV_246761 [Trichonephila clavipes]|nr:hypothetical protein TNCV_246761 [Trichonephila clavipes]
MYLFQNVLPKFPWNTDPLSVHNTTILNGIRFRASLPRKSLPSVKALRVDSSSVSLLPAPCRNSCQKHPVMLQSVTSEILVMPIL